jgi:alpha-tubulin suppressor-like RCC1 family protein
MSRAIPVRVIGIGDAVALGVGAKHSCAVRRDGTAWCWGANDVGQLGTGGLADSHLAVPALLACP